MNPRAYISWSGGKDAALSLHRIRQTDVFRIDCLLTNLGTAGNAPPRIAMHGVRKELLEAQARSIGLPLETIELPDQPGMEIYENAMNKKLASLKARGITHGIYGDIFLEDLRQYRATNLAKHSLTPVFPLWQQSSLRQPSLGLIHEFIDAGFKAIVVCVDASKLPQRFCGRLIDRSFVEDLPSDIDPCGENGEFHSFVFDGPIFDHPVAFGQGKIVYRELKAAQAGKTMSGFYFCDLLYPINA